MTKMPNHATFAIRKPNSLLGSLKGWFNGDSQLIRAMPYARMPIQDEWALRKKRFNEFDLSSLQRRYPTYDIRSHHVRRF